jgi:selenocysteine lyase/cysteine desulfurase
VLAGYLDSKRDLQREEVLSAFELITQMELPLQESLIEYLQGKNPQITLVGPRSADPQQRVSTISFTHQTVLPSAIAKRLQERNFAVRNGHMYAYRLVEMLQVRLRLHRRLFAE